MLLEDAFLDREGAYRPVPWWAWTGRLDPVLLREQLCLMREQGLRQFFIYPVYGMEWEYLGADHLRGIAAVLETCRTLGMQAWIYDEHSWPSGTAGGRVARHHPQAIAWVVEVARTEGVTPAEALALAAEESVLHACVMESGGAPHVVRNGGLPAAARLDVVHYRLRRDTTRNLTVRGSLWAKGERGVLDMLSAEACGRFIREAYDRVTSRFPEACGTTLVGFFTDEPAFPPGVSLIPWTEGLREQFREEYGYDLVDRLSDLTFDTETSERTRVAYHSLVTRLSARSFTGQIADWCAARGLVLTGHMLSEEESVSVKAHGDTPAHLRRMHVPGCDLLQMYTDYDGAPPDSVYQQARILKTPKIASSSARAATRRRVMCEAFGIAPWTRTMADEKRMTDWLVALGINLINDSSLTTDISGFRKRATSGKHFTQPWWPHAHLLYEYAGRLSALCANTTLEAELAVLYPTTSWWALARHGLPKSEEAVRSEEALDGTVEALVHAHWDFEFLFEDVLAGSPVQDGALATPYGAFRTIVLAGVHRLPSAAAARLEEFGAAGGNVILVDSEPVAMEQTANRALNLEATVKLSVPYDAGFRKRLDEALRRVVWRRWSISGERADEVISAARVDEGGRALLLLSNQTQGGKRLGIQWRRHGTVEVWDAASGARWTPSPAVGAAHTLSIMLPEGESMWLVQASAQLAAGQPPAWWLRESEQEPDMQIGGPWGFEAAPANMLRLPCRLRVDVDGKLAPEELTPDDDSWLETEWGEVAVELRPEEMHAYWLESVFHLDETAEDLSLIADSPEVMSVHLNGRALAPPTPRTVWNHTNQAWWLGDACQLGTNRVLVKVRPSPYYARHVAAFPIVANCFEPVVLWGRFGVQEHDRWSVRIGRLPETLEVGDWRGQGFPHFSGTGVYERAFEWSLPESPALFICDAGRDAVELILDGVSLGVRAWGPRAFVAQRVTPGVHRLQVRISNTLGALLRRGYLVTRAPGPTGLLSEVKVFALAR